MGGLHSFPSMAQSIVSMSWTPNWPNGIGSMGADLQPSLPARMTTREVCELGRISPVTLWRRRRTGIYKLTPCDCGRELLYDRSEVLQAFGMVPLPASDESEQGDWAVDPETVRAALARRRGPGVAPPIADVPGPKSRRLPPRCG